MWISRVIWRRVLRLSNRVNIHVVRKCKSGKLEIGVLAHGNHLFCAFQFTGIMLSKNTIIFTNGISGF